MCNYWSGRLPSPTRGGLWVWRKSIDGKYGTPKVCVTLIFREEGYMGINEGPNKQTSTLHTQVHKYVHACEHTSTSIYTHTHTHFKDFIWIHKSHIKRTQTFQRSLMQNHLRNQKAPSPPHSLAARNGWNRAIPSQLFFNLKATYDKPTYVHTHSLTLWETK